MRIIVPTPREALKAAARARSPAVKAKRDGKPFFVWHNTTRMHVWTFLSKKYSAMQNNETNYGLE